MTGPLKAAAPSWPKNLGWSVAGAALGLVVFTGLTHYQDKDALFLNLACISSFIWLSLISKDLNPIAGLNQPFWFDWILVGAMTACFITLPPTSGLAIKLR